MNLIPLYTAVATAIGGRSGGIIKTADGAIEMRLGLPVELGGETESAAVNPEQLFACAWAASFADAIGFAAKRQNRILREISVTATVKLGQYENNGFGIAADFAVNVPELSPSETEEIIKEARLICPYAKAFQSAENLRVTLQT